MPRLDYKTCRNCNRHVSECGTLSRRRLCADCGHDRLEENMLGISTKSGVAYRRQIIGTVAAALQNPRLVNALAEAGAFPTLDDSQVKP